jgi:hypothetical protein
MIVIKNIWNRQTKESVNEQDQKQLASHLSAVLYDLGIENDVEVK